MPGAAGLHVIQKLLEPFDLTLENALDTEKAAAPSPFVVHEEMSRARRLPFVIEKRLVTAVPDGSDSVVLLATSAGAPLVMSTPVWLSTFMSTRA